MSRTFPILICLCAIVAPLAGACAQGAPLALPGSTAAKTPAQKAIEKSATPAKVPTMDAATAIQRANAWFNANRTMIGDFTQMGADGRQTTGKFYVDRPGKMRFTYASPATLDVIADGTTVRILDRKLPTAPNDYFIWQTPLKFLLKDKIDIASDTKVLDVKTTPVANVILIEDKATFGGTSRIRLVFDPESSALKQWIVTDPQGYETNVMIANVDYKKKPDPTLFKINFEHFN